MVPRQSASWFEASLRYAPHHEALEGAAQAELSAAPHPGEAPTPASPHPEVLRITMSPHPEEARSAVSKDEGDLPRCRGCWVCAAEGSGAPASWFEAPLRYAPYHEALEGAAQAAPSGALFLRKRVSQSPHSRWHPGVGPVHLEMVARPRRIDRHGGRCVDEKIANVEAGVLRSRFAPLVLIDGERAAGRNKSFDCPIALEAYRGQRYCCVQF